MEEHKEMLGIANRLWDLARQDATQEHDVAQGREDELLQIAEQLVESDRHYLREENVLFPYLEKHGITEPPAIMWMEHDRIRSLKKDLLNLIEGQDSPPGKEESRLFETMARSLTETLAGHFQKENGILFPSALEVLSDDEWLAIRDQFDEIGYCSFTPDVPQPPVVGKPAPRTEEKNEVHFEAGSLSPREIEGIFNNLPVDITFVGKDDTVRYFSQTKDRIFVRSKAVIGRKVQNCHPQKSVHVVNKIVEDFKAKRRDSAAFWIDLNGRLVYIRYFPVWDKSGEYLGCIEVTQDITDIKTIEGERRLLDETNH